MTICGLLELLAANRLEGGVWLSSEDGNERADGRVGAAIAFVVYSNESSLKSNCVVYGCFCTRVVLFVFSTNCHGNTLKMTYCKRPLKLECHYVKGRRIGEECKTLSPSPV